MTKVDISRISESNKNLQKIKIVEDEKVKERRNSNNLEDS